MTLTKNALVKRIERHNKLTPEERDIIAKLESNVVARRKRSLLFGADSHERLAIIQSGWAVARTTLTRGLTSISQIYLPGDLVGLSDIGFRDPPHEVIMQTDGSAALIDRRALAQLARDHAHIMVLILSLASIDDIVLRDRMHTVTRMSAEDRLIHLMLALKSRTAQLTDQPSDRFPLHLSQRDIGDALGLTDIYVNRLIRKLTQNGEIDISRPYVRITDRQNWEKRVGYKDRYQSLDTSWISRGA